MYVSFLRLDEKGDSRSRVHLHGHFVMRVSRLLRYQRSHQLLVFFRLAFHWTLGRHHLRSEVYLV